MQGKGFASRALFRILRLERDRLLERGDRRRGHARESTDAGGRAARTRRFLDYIAFIMTAPAERS